MTYPSVRNGLLRAGKQHEGTMAFKSDAVATYLAELEAIADLDRNYYMTETPSLHDRASYALRQQHLARLREQFWAKTSVPTENAPPPQAGQCLVRVKDHTSGGEVVSSPQCLLVHDLNNALGVVIGHCELMSELAAKDETIRGHLEEILKAAQKMATHLRKRACPNLRGQQ